MENQIFQAFARTSKVLREDFKTFTDKVILGISSCKIYDQYHVKGAIFVSVMAIILKTVQPQMNMFVRSAFQIALRGNADQIIENVSIVSSEHCQKENASSADDLECPSLRKAREDMKKHLNMHM